jgi:poly(hydroxyalkanoate) depolymerase family esterase
MDHGFPARLTRLTRRLLRSTRSPTRAVESALHDLTELLGNAQPAQWMPSPLSPVSPLSPLSPKPAPAPAPANGFAPGTFGETTGFGANPGQLHMLQYLPAQKTRVGAPLLVLLHGCGQDAAGFARASGFTALADRVGAPLVLPQQQQANNQGGCFNWFQPGDVGRGGGEAASIAQMVARAIQQYKCDPAQVFVAGLSAGGAMAAALLAAYPDVFAAGGVVAGLPVGAATDLRSALARMKSVGNEAAEDWAARASLARAGGIVWPHVPRLSVWSGNADRTVDPANADALVAQFTRLHGLPETPDRDEDVAPGIRRLAWGGAVEQWRLAGFGHAFPAASMGTDPFVQPAAVPAAEAMGRFWGLLPA